MFLIIRPQDREKYASNIKQLYGKLAHSWGCNAAEAREQIERKDAVYIVYAPKDHGIMGFARLSPIASSKNTWSCDNVEMFDSVQSLEHQRQLIFIRWFYEGLYECLHTFALTHKVNRILTSNFEGEHDDIKFFGGWPFLSERKENDICRGVLAMNNNAYRFFQSQRELAA